MNKTCFLFLKHINEKRCLAKVNDGDSSLLSYLEDYKEKILYILDGFAFYDINEISIFCHLIGFPISDMQMSNR
jgi:hypothetical protein